MWYKIAKSIGNEFDFSREEKDLWSVLIKREQERSRINFDLENDSNIGELRKIKLEKAKSIFDNSSVFVLAQLYHAGGDWQNSISYFRCQFIENKAKDEKFIYIPSLKEGNSNLVLSSNKSDHFVALDNKGSGKNWEKPDEKKMWNSLKQYATKLFNSDYKEKEGISSFNLVSIVRRKK
jgi:hypothetical protein